MRNVTTKRVQCDEIWSFVGMKEKTAKKKGKDRPADAGDVWTWTAIDADSKLVIAWFIGDRDAGCAYEFMLDLEGRLANRVQLTTDGHKAYLSAVGGAFGSTGIDYAQLVKIYGPDPNEGAAHRYSPPQCLGAEPTRVYGDPDPEHISTSYVERSNLTMRMHMRRFTRLTNAFSKKTENHCHMVALYTCWYNFVKLHKTLRVTPAMEAKLTDHVWTLEDFVQITDNWEADEKEKVVPENQSGDSN